MAQKKGAGKPVVINFNPFSVSPETAKTAILLLRSEEPDLITNTLHAITQYLSQDTSNITELLTLQPIPKLLPLIGHPQINIVRFALKDLAILARVPEAAAEILSDPENLRKVCLLLTKMEDVFVLEFASLLLAMLTKFPEGCTQLMSANVIVTLFNRMRNSLDPDVQKNCLQILLNCIEDKVCVDQICESPQFQWPALLSLVSNKFLAIQHTSLKTIDMLLRRYDDFNIKKTFKASLGVCALCDLLECYEFRDIHNTVLGVLTTYVNGGEDASAHVFETGCLQRILAYLVMAPLGMKRHALRVCAQMSFSNCGRNALYTCDADLVFCEYLTSTDSEILAEAALGAGNMCKILRSAIRMADTNVMESFAVILTSDGAPWYNTRMNTLLAMSKFIPKIEKAAGSAVEPTVFASLRHINLIESDAPIEARRLACQIYLNFLSYQVSTKAMMDPQFITEVINIVKSPDIQLKILALKVLTGLAKDEYAKNYLIESSTERIIGKYLRTEHVSLRKALCNLIAESVTIDNADVYVESEILHYLLENKKARYTIPEWEVAIEAIVRQHPSAKLAYTGRLDMTDFTNDGFYIMKRLEYPLPTMSEILNSRSPLQSPVLVSIVHPNPFEKSCSSFAGFSRGLSLSRTNVTKSRSTHRMPITHDQNLREYIMKLRLWFGDPSKSLQFLEISDAHFEVRWRDKCNEVSSSLKTRAQLIGEFVAEQMNGLSQEGDCSLPSVETHLSDLMMKTESRVVSLGIVTCGGALERAMLYKVLADRLGLPCSLHRSTNAVAWVEVAVPDMDPNEDLKEEAKYPAGFLKANYIVDLMDNPGRLVPIQSREAEWIRGPKCAPLYVALRRPPLCKCRRSCTRPSIDDDSSISARSDTRL